MEDMTAAASQGSSPWWEHSAMFSTVMYPALCSSGTNIQSMFMSFLTCQAKWPLSSWCRELVAGASELWQKSHSHWKEAQGSAGPFVVLGQR